MLNLEWVLSSLCARVFAHNHHLHHRDGSCLRLFDTLPFRHRASSAMTDRRSMNADIPHLLPTDMACTFVASHLHHSSTRLASTLSLHAWHFRHRHLLAVYSDHRTLVAPPTNSRHLFSIMPTVATACSSYPLACHVSTATPLVDQRQACRVSF